MCQARARSLGGKGQQHAWEGEDWSRDSCHLPWPQDGRRPPQCRHKGMGDILDDPYEITLVHTHTYTYTYSNTDRQTHTHARTYTQKVQGTNTSMNTHARTNGWTHGHQAMPPHTDNIPLPSHAAHRIAITQTPSSCAACGQNLRRTLSRRFSAGLPTTFIAYRWTQLS